MRLSVLDQSTASKDRTQDTAIRETLELARHCDALGYHRYWLSEHHNSGTIVGTAPEILMAAIAATTAHIRIGSAGIMLPHYSALKVAEQFRVLEAIAPGRIDLGVGRAPGSDQMTSYALNPNPQNVLDQFPRQVQELQHWVSGTPLPEGHPFRTIVAQPTYGFSAARTMALNLPPILVCLTHSRTFSARAPVSNRPWNFTVRTFSPAKIISSRSRRFASGRWRLIAKKKRCTSSKPVNAQSSIANRASVYRSCRPTTPIDRILLPR
jgi:luciferase family oxidoreductase group 1